MKIKCFDCGESYEGKELFSSCPYCNGVELLSKGYQNE